MFSAITVEGNSLYYNAYEVEDGKAVRVDNFAIEKTDNESPSDKAGSFGTILEDFITSIDFSFAWQFTTFFFSAVARIMQFFNMTIG
jgi:hypothetical protein